MSNYLLIESRDPFESGEVVNDYELAVNLANAGHNVTMFLVQNGVLPARTAVNHDGFTQLINSNVDVMTDDFSLRERGILHNQLVDKVTVVPIDVVVDQLVEGRKAMWL